MSDEGQTGGDVYVVPAAGGAAKNITPNLEGSARALAWRADGRMLFQEYVDGKSALVTVAASGGARTTVWSAPQQMTDAVGRRAGRRAAAWCSRSQHAPEVYAGPIGALDRADDDQRGHQAAVGRGEEPALDRATSITCRAG